MVQDVTPDIATKMFNECIFLTRQDAKEVLFIKMNKELSLTTYSDFSKISQKFDFGMMKTSKLVCSLFMIMIIL